MMPCNSDYMNANEYEIEISRVACLLDELGGKKWERGHWDGYHPKVYNKKVNGDAMVARLCEEIQKRDVSNYSLEMQIWWRDHQAADKARLEREQKAAKSKVDRDAALSKLTDYERKLLGI